MVFFLPHHMCRLLGIRLRNYLEEAFVLPLALCVPMVVLLIWLQQKWPPHGLIQLGIRVTLALSVYGAGVLWAVWTKRAWKVGTLGDEAVSNDVAVGLVETYQQEEA
jgi:hypothetical protein